MVSTCISCTPRVSIYRKTYSVPVYFSLAIIVQYIYVPLSSLMQETVQVVAHCVGSITLHMSLLSGALEGKVRSLVCSQVATKVWPTTYKKIQAGIFLAEVLTALGVPGITAYDDADASWSEALFDKFVKTSAKLSTPYDELCSSPVCHR